MKKTILYDEHIKAGGKIVEFGGFLLPIEYSSIAEEHAAVRNDVGVFDVSHMGEIRVTGKDTIDFLNYLLTNDMRNFSNGKMIYNFMLYEDGGVVDDLMVYKYSDTECLLVVNASNTDKDYAYMLEHKGQFDVVIINESLIYGQLALQGPKAIEILRSISSNEIDNLKLFDFKHIEIMDNDFLVSRSGYTGSDGFEIYGENNNILVLFRKLMSMQVTPCGLGCRDTLRFEAGMPLYGHEIDSDITPIEAGLKYAVNINKNFIGKEKVSSQIENGVSRKIVGLEILERGIARNGYDVLVDGAVIGKITTGYMIPNSNNIYAMALIDSTYAEIGTEVNIQIRKNLVKAKIRNKNFLKKKYVK